MNFFKKIWYRTRQLAVYVGMAFCPWRQPELLQGEGCFFNSADFLVKHGAKHPLVVCSQSALDRNALDGFFKGAEGALVYSVYAGVTPNPTVKQVEEGYSVFLYENCDSILAFGGGSPIDCAKGIAARVANPVRSLRQMTGLMKVGKKTPPIFAVPTTAGSGSECTLAAVITDVDTHDKFVINAFSLIPRYAVLDPSLTIGLSPELTATTGMDALTHAVEAYIGRANTSSTKSDAENAVSLILENLPEAVRFGKTVQVRANMQEAAYLAGRAFTRAFVGYTHALAHALGGMYNISHGLANAVLLPIVLRKYGETAHKKLAALAKAVNVAAETDEDSVAAEKFISTIEEMNAKLGIPQKLDVIRPEDIPQLVTHAEREANPLYPVPQLWDRSDFDEVLRKVM